MWDEIRGSASPLRPRVASFNVDDHELQVPVPGDKPGVSPEWVQQANNRAQLGVTVMTVLGFLDKSIALQGILLQ